MTTMIFADFGAEVIQVERPGGSPLRSMAAWPFWMRGKQSVVLDLHDADERDAARSLALDADVLVEAFGPGVAEGFGLGFDDLARANPALVYTSISGFGHRGPFA